MSEAFKKIGQIILKSFLGIGIYYGIKAFFPSVNENWVIVATLIATTSFAELIEARYRK